MFATLMHYAPLNCPFIVLPSLSFFVLVMQAFISQKTRFIRHLQTSSVVSPLSTVHHRIACLHLHKGCVAVCCTYYVVTHGYGSLTPVIYAYTHTTQRDVSRTALLFCCLILSTLTVLLLGLLIVLLFIL